jgi:hypothetical protein
MASDFGAGRWSAMGDKIVQLAEAFPAEQYEFRPAGAARSFAEQLRHVAFWNVYLLRMMRGEEADGDANELPRDEYPSRDRIIPVLRSSFGEVAAELGRPGRDGAADAEAVLPYVEHGAEHYGQLAVYCRLNGVVPPASRS